MLLQFIQIFRLLKAGYTSQAVKHSETVLRFFKERNSTCRFIKKYYSLGAFILEAVLYL
jgi:hypothetical protein